MRVKKLLSVVIVLCLLLAMLPMAAMAYTVSFDANGGSGSMAEESDISGDYGLPENGFVPPEGMIFGGWSTNPYSASEPISAGEVYTITDDTTFYPLWTPAWESNLWVSGILVTEANAGDVLGDGGSVSYDFDTGILSLSHAVIANPEGYGIYAENMDLIIDGAEGASSISGAHIPDPEDPDSYTPGIAIFAEGSLTITGTLGNVSSQGDGIVSYGEMIIEGTIGDIVCEDGDGIRSDFDRITIAEDGLVGNITAASYSSYAITARSDIVIDGTVGTLSGGYGLQTITGDITITGTLGKITADIGGIEAYCVWEYVYAEDIDDFEYVYISGGNLYIDGSAIQIEAGVCGGYLEGFLDLNACTLDITVEEEEGNFALAAAEGFGWSGCVITLPENHNITGMDMGGGMYCTTMADEYGEIAFRVRIEPGFTVYLFDYPSVGEMEEQQVLLNGTVTRPADPSCTGYTFGGWYVDEDLTIEYDFSTPVTETTFLYAKWTRNISGWRPGAGSTNPNTGNAVAGSTVTIPVTGTGSSLHAEAQLDGDTAELKPVPESELALLDGSHIVVDFSDLPEEIRTVIIPAEFLACVSEIGSLTISLSGADAEFDAAALQAIAAAAKAAEAEVVTLRIAASAADERTAAQQQTIASMPEALTLSIRLLVNGEELHSLGSGSARIVVPFAPASPDFVSVWYVAADGTREAVPCFYHEGRQNVSIFMNHFSTYVITADEAHYAHVCPSEDRNDVDQSQWYHEAVDYALQFGLMNGVDSSLFDPNGSTSRAMIVTVLWRLEGEPACGQGKSAVFPDVPADSWYTEAVEWAAAAGIVLGYDDGSFGPNDAITREQLASILYRYEQYKGSDVSVGENTNILSYEDAFDISDWAIPAMQWACGAGLMEGDGALLSPTAQATRAQSAALLMRFCEIIH